MSEELRPCPFCGSLNIREPENENGWLCVKCGSERFGDWNTRPIEDDLRKRIAELEEKQRWRVVANGELPKKNDYYWARDDFGEQGRILFYDGEWNKFTNLSYITHWMPLPEPPEVQE